MALAGIAAGADGIMVEVHPDPPAALSDGHQALKIERFKELMEKIRHLAMVVDRSVDVVVGGDHLRRPAEHTLLRRN
jgi:3-deoxy-7-phosphoheptulonate synthase